MARPPSWQLNRHTFDRDIQAMVTKDEAIERIHGIVTDIALDGKTGHRIQIKTAADDLQSIQADWVIDATGRRQVLGRKLDLIEKSEGQRDCFWFRLADFDRSLLSKLNALGPQPPAEGEEYHYDRYYSTHHFMGAGNWIWLIPLRAEDGSELISVGISSRPDVYPHDVRTIEEFLERVGEVHGVVADFVRSGQVIDTNILRNYHYVARKVYSPDRWALVGDAAFAPDPLFSNGLAFATIQLEQVGEMIARDGEGNHSPEIVDALSEAFLAPVVSSQIAIANWYKSMDDAYLCSLRLNWIEIAYFHMVLPLVVNRCHYDPERTSLWRFLQFKDPQEGFELPQKLIEARARIDKLKPEHFIYRGKKKVNLRALEVVKDLADVREQIVAGAELRQQYVKDVLERIPG